MGLFVEVGLCVEVGRGGEAVVLCGVPVRLCAVALALCSVVGRHSYYIFRSVFVNENAERKTRSP